MENIVKENSEEILLDIFKQACINFRNCFNKNLDYFFKEDILEHGISLNFHINFGEELEYKIEMKKQNVNVDYIPKLKGHQELESLSNPFKSLKYTDENYILGEIYDLINQYPLDEIVCYQRFGILIRNPLKLKGIYNINIKYMDN